MVFVAGRASRKTCAILCGFTGLRVGTGRALSGGMSIEASAPRVTPELLRRLEVAAPRYTSYPTVPVWSDRFCAADHASALRQAGAAAGEPLSLYIHIPFCRELCSYCGCNVVITRDQSRVERYMAAVARELGLVQSCWPRAAGSRACISAAARPPFSTSGSSRRCGRPSPRIS
jgi:hypothetical protein